MTVRCPFCTVDNDKVVDSRLADDGGAIRRRRECAGCGQRYTTFERVEEVSLSVVKRSGDREPFERDKIVSGLRSALKNRPIDEVAMSEIAVAVEEAVREFGRDVTSEEVGLVVLEQLRLVDDVAFIRFASVYKGFEDAADFAAELRELVKSTAPKSKLISH
jgi:transcriptional repressor NrdR